MKNVARQRAFMFALLLAVAAGALWFVKFRKKGDTDATPVVTQSGSGSSKTTTTSAATTTTSASDAPAKITFIVKDDKGPIANAQLRIAPDAESDQDARELATKTTGPDGTVIVDLASGPWSISASASGHEPARVDKTFASGENRNVEIALVAGGKSLTGTVTDASGGPIAGARIDASKTQMGLSRSERGPIAMAITGADGKYALSVPMGQLQVSATHSDYAPVAKYVDLGEAGATADFALVPGGVIEGVVLDEKTRAPLAGKVYAHRDGGGMMAFGESGMRIVAAGPDGKFRVAGLRPGNYDLDAETTTGMSSREAVRLGLGVAEQVADVEILVATLPKISGKVVDDKDAPVAGAHIMTFGAGGGGDSASPSGADGTFTISGLGAGKWSLMASGEQVVPNGTTQVELADKDVTGVVVKTRHALKVTGHVEPREACDVRLDLDQSALRDGSMPMLVAPVRSSATDGTFTMTPVSAGKATIAARCDNGDQGSVEATLDEKSGEVVVKVAPGASIAGRVTDTTGKPVPNATVMASATSGTEHLVIVNGRFTSGAQALTNASGNYEIKGLTAGSYRLAALDRGKPMKPHGDASKASVTLGETEHETGVDLAVELPNGKITGTVTTADGKPLADAWVSVRQDMAAMMEAMTKAPGGSGDSRMMTIEARDDGEGESASGYAPVLTDASGHFAVTGLASGVYEVVAEAQAGKLRGRAQDVKPDANVTIAAVGLSTLSGTVKGAAGVYTVDIDGPTRGVRSFANADGSFSFGRVDPGAYDIRVTSSSGNGTAKVTVKPATPATVDIALVANAIVTGKVVDAEGKPAGGIGVALIEDTGDGRISLSLEGPPPTSAPDGTFRVETTSGKKILLLMTPPRPTTKRGLVLEAGKTFDAGTITIGKDDPPRPGPGSGSGK